MRVFLTCCAALLSASILLASDRDAHQVAGGLSDDGLLVLGLTAPKKVRCNANLMNHKTPKCQGAAGSICVTINRAIMGETVGVLNTVRIETINDFCTFASGDNSCTGISHTRIIDPDGNPRSCTTNTPLPPPPAPPAPMQPEPLLADAPFANDLDEAFLD